jgi:D-alanyl-D-alanine carboxypeptidase
MPADPAMHGGHPPRRPGRVVSVEVRRRRVSAMAALAVVAGLSVLGLLRMHQSSSPALITQPGTAAAAAHVGGLQPPSPISGYAYSESWLRTNPQVALGIDGQEAIVVDEQTRRVLYELNAHRRHAIASLTKITTAQIALDNASPSSAVVVPTEATQVDPDLMGLSPGETVSVHDLLYGMLLDSGNDAAEALSRQLIPRSRFIREMNDRAVALGLHDTSYVNPTGFDDRFQFSSPYDVAVLSTYLLEHYPLLREIVGTREYPIDATAGHKAFDPTNLNRLLSTYPGAIGVKPGYTGDADYCLSAAATRGGRTVIAVVLGSNVHFTDGGILLDYGFQRIAQGG